MGEVSSLDRPFIAVNIAMTADGKIAPDHRRHLHHLLLSGPAASARTTSAFRLVGLAAIASAIGRPEAIIVLYAAGRAQQRDQEQDAH